MLEHSLFQVLDLPGTAAQKPQIQADAEAMKKREFIEHAFFVCLFSFCEFRGASVFHPISRIEGSPGFRDFVGSG